MNKEVSVIKEMRYDELVQYIIDNDIRQKSFGNTTTTLRVNAFGAISTDSPVDIYDKFKVKTELDTLEKTISTQSESIAHILKFHYLMIISQLEPESESQKSVIKEMNAHIKFINDCKESMSLSSNHLQKSKAYDEIMRIHRETEGEDFMVSISVLRRKIEEIINSNPDIDESRL